MGAYESAYVPLTPTISITTRANGAIYTRGQAVSAALHMHSGSGHQHRRVHGLGACTASASVGALIDKSTVGARTFTVTADDADGVRATASATYTVTQARTLTVPVLTGRRDGPQLARAGAPAQEGQDFGRAHASFQDRRLTTPRPGR